MIKKCILVLLLSVSLYGQDNNGLAFLKLDTEAAGAAVAGAMVANASGAGAAFWNPAGLSNAQLSSFVVSINNGLAGMSHNFAAVQFLQGKHNWALSLNYFNIPGIQIRGAVPTDEPAGEVDAFNLAAGLSYARNFSTDWQVGITIKYLFEKYYLASAPGWALDLGLQRKSVFTDTDFGFVVQNIGKMSKLETESTPLPIIIRSGITYNVPFGFEDNLFISPEVKYVNKETVFVLVGAAYVINQYLTIRTGFTNGQQESVFKIGAGLSYNKMHFDYAYSGSEYDLEPLNWFSFAMQF